MDKKTPLTIAIDTSCDETSVSVVKGFTILSNIQPSQMKYHKKYGGVVPSLAKFAHEERIDNVVVEAMKRAQVDWKDIDVVAVTQGPGLAIALEVGIKKAKELSKKHNKPLIAVNHMEGHLLSALAERKSNKKKTKFSSKLKSLSNNFPVLGFLISGGHTELVLVKEFNNYTIVGKTLDDSAGEAYDKCGRIIGLGYPAGPVITEFAKQHRKEIKFEVKNDSKSTKVIGTNKNSGAVYTLPISMARSSDLNMSYSGLKTAFKELAENLAGGNISYKDQLKKETKMLTKKQILDLAVVFEEATIKQLEIKLTKAIKEYSPNEIWLGGGVVASARVRSKLRSIARKFNIDIKYPFSNKLMTDNAAMIGVAANVKIYKSGIIHNPGLGIYLREIDDIDRNPNLKLN